jgi:hypothetical protein
MEIVRDVKSFVERNGEQLQRFFIYKTGITDRELIHEHLQEFYVKMIQTRALESFDEKEGSFDTYISTLLCWMLPYRAKKNVSVQYKFVSRVFRDGRPECDAEDVWDHTGTFEGPYKVDFSPCTPRSFDENDEELFSQYLKDFKKYIQKTESEKVTHQMFTFLSGKQMGLRSSDIAILLGVSDNMVKIIKQRIQVKFERWKTLS